MIAQNGLRRLSDGNRDQGTRDADLRRRCDGQGVLHHGWLVSANIVDRVGTSPLAELERRLQGQDVRYLSTLPPEFNPEQPSPEATHVVVALDMDEPPGQFLTHTGYYLLPQLSPSEAEVLIFPRASRET